MINEMMKVKDTPPVNPKVGGLYVRCGTVRGQPYNFPLHKLKNRLRERQTTIDRLIY